MKYPCAFCGQAVFKTIKDYELHRIDFHGFKPEKVKPTRLTSRTKDQIVKEAEASWLKAYLVLTPETVSLKTYINDTIEPVAIKDDVIHLNTCTCNQCFTKKLDALVEKSQKDLEEMKKFC